MDRGYHAAAVDARRSLLTPLAGLAALAVLAAGCTRDAQGDAPPESPTVAEPTASGEGDLPTRDPGGTEFLRGAFTYRFDAVLAELTWDGGEGELVVRNRSGREIGEPSLVAITQDQREVAATVRDARPIADGEKLTFAIAFPDELTYERMGLIKLLFGDQDWGVFSPVPASPAPEG